jgi:hypothetical protein
MVGRSWFVSEESLISYKAQVEEIQKQKSVSEDLPKQDVPPVGLIESQSLKNELPETLPTTTPVEEKPKIFSDERPFIERVKEQEVSPELKEYTQNSLVKKIAKSPIVKNPSASFLTFTTLGKKALVSALSLSFVILSLWAFESRQEKIVADNVGQSSLAAVVTAPTDVTRGALELIALGTYEAFHPLFGGIGNAIVRLLSDDASDRLATVSTDTARPLSLTIATTTDNAPVLEAIATLRTEMNTSFSKVFDGISSILGQSYRSSAGSEAVVTSVPSSSGVTSAEMTSQLASVYGILQAQINRLVGTTTITTQNVRNARDINQTAKISGSQISNSTISDSVFSGGSILTDSLVVTGNTQIGGNLSATGTISFGNITNGCLQTDANGNVTSTGIACGTGMGSWSTTSEAYYWSNNRDFSVQGSPAYLAPTTTLGLIVNASSTLSNLVSVNSTSTNATSTNLFTSNLSRVGDLSTYTQISNTALSFIAPGADYSLTSSGGIFRINTNTQAPLAFNTNGIERARVSDAGLFGVATSVPWAQLSVNPNGIAGPSFVVGSSTKTDFMVTNGGNVAIGTSTSNFGSNGGRLVIDDTKDGQSVVRLLNLSDSANSYAEFNVRAGSINSYLGATPLNSSVTTGAASAGRGYVWNSGTGNLGLDIVTASPNTDTRFYTGGSSASNERMRITSTGNIGIGTTSPFAKLSVAGDAYVNGNVSVTGVVNIPRTSTNDAGGLPSLRFDTDELSIRGNSAQSSFDLMMGNTYPRVRISATRIGLGSDNTMTWYSAANGIVYGSADTGISRLSAGVLGIGNGTQGNSSGTLIVNNLGIGTTSPFAKLSVAGDAYIGGNLTATGTATVVSSAGNQLRLGYDASRYLDTTVSSQGLVTFQNNPSTLSGGNSMFTFRATAGAALGSYNLVAFADENGVSKFTVDNSGTVNSASGLYTSSNNGSLEIRSGYGGTSGATPALILNGGPSHGMALQIQDGGSTLVSVRGSDGATGPVGAVGIGTTSPFAKLSVAGDAYIGGNLTATGTLSVSGTTSFGTTTVTNLIVTNTSTSTFAGPISNTSGNLIVASGNASNLLLNPYGGNVGIGTTTPSEKLRVAGNVRVDGDITIANNSRLLLESSGVNYIDGKNPSGVLELGMSNYTILYRAGLGQFAGFGVGLSGGQGSYLLDRFAVGTTTLNNIQFVVQGAGSTSGTSAVNVTNSLGTSMLLVRNDGNVGIGTTTPNARLSVKSSAANTDLINGYRQCCDERKLFGLRESAVGVGELFLYDGFGTQTAVIGGANSYFNGGSVAIGTTTSTASLNVYKSTVGTATIIQNIDGNPGRSGLLVQATDSTASGVDDYILRLQNNSGTITRFTVNKDGNVGIGTTSPFAKLSVAGDAYIGGNLTATGTVTLNTSTTITSTGVNVGTSGYFYGVDPGTSGDVNNSYQPSSGTLNSYAGITTIRDSQFNRRIYLDAQAYKIHPGEQSAVMTYTGWDGGGGTLGGDVVVRGGNAGTAGGAVAGNLYLRPGNQNGLSGTPADVIFQGYTVASTPVLQEIGRWKGPSGNFGIGTTTPATKLDVWGNMQVGTSSTPTFLVNTASNRVGVGSANPAADFDVAEQLFTVYTGSVRGTVGIGTLTPGAIDEELVISNGWGGSVDTSIVFEQQSAPSPVKVGLNGTGMFSVTNYSSGASLLSIDSTTGNTGIGTSSPWAKLSVNNFGGTQPQFVVASSTGAGATTTSFIVTSNGNVGVGTSTPATILHLESVAPVLTFNATNNSSGARFQSVQGSTPSTNNAFRFQTGGGAELMAITYAGNVGIGTTSPWAKLSVSSFGGTQPQFVVASSTGSGATTTSFIVDRFGNVGIGTSSPIAKLTLEGGSFFQAGGSVTSSSTPTIVGGIKDNSLLAGAASVFVYGRYAYVANSFDDSLRVIDVSNPTAPVIVGGVKDASLLDSANAVSVSGHYAYVTSYTDNSLRVIDVSNPTAPVIVGGIKDNSLLAGAQAVSISGPYAYVISNSDDSLRIIDVSSSTAPVIIGGIKNISLLDGASSVSVSGRYAYVTSYVDNSLRIIDVSNPASPFIVGGVKDNTLLAGASSVSVSGRYAYVANQTDSSLRIIDVSNPATPVIVGGVKNASLLNVAISVSVSGRYAYVANYSDDSLRIIDVSSSTAPVMIGGIKNISLLDGATSVSVSGRYAYVTTQSDSSLRIIDISGIEVQSALVHALEAGTLQTQGNAIIGNNLHISNSLNIGANTMIEGTLTVANTSTTTASTFNSVAATFARGNVGIGTTSPWAKLSVTNTGSGPSFIVEDATSPDTTPFIIDASGNVGIGTTTPQQKLSVVGGGITLDNNTSENGIYFTTAGGTARMQFYRVAGQNDLRVKSSNGGVINSGDLMTWDYDAGNVGVATNTPWGLFSINPDVAMGSAPSFVIGSSTATRFIVNNAGNVGIGTTSPQRLLHVYRNSDGPPVRFEDSNGYCEIDPTSTSWTCTSDRNLKKDIVDLSSMDTLSRIAELNAVSFRWNKDVETDPLRYGFIAQDVEQVFPELVLTADNGLKSVMYGGFTPFIVEAIKELGLSVATLDARVDVLDATITGIASTTASLASTTADLTARLDATASLVASLLTQASSTASTTPVETTQTIVWSSDIGTQMLSFLQSVGLRIENGIAYVQGIVSDVVTTKKLTVGDSANLAAAGVTILDRATGQPACVYIENSIVRSEGGACGALPTATSDGSPTAPVIITDPVPTPIVDETATSTPETVETTEPVPEPIVEPAPEVTPTPEPAPETVVSAPTESITTP